MPKTAPRDPGFSTVDLQPVIYNPDEQGSYADQQGYRESLHQKEKRAKKMKPQEGVSGVGKGGRLGTSEQQSLVRNMFPYVRVVRELTIGTSSSLRIRERRCCGMRKRMTRRSRHADRPYPCMVVKSCIPHILYRIPSNCNQTYCLPHFLHQLLVRHGAAKRPGTIVQTRIDPFVLQRPGRPGVHNDLCLLPVISRTLGTPTV